MTDHGVRIKKSVGFAAVAFKDGLIYASKAGWFENCASPMVAEFRGVLAGFELAKQLNLEVYDVVSDSVEVVWAVSSGL